jgi:hypothetical protein
MFRRDRRAIRAAGVAAIRSLPCFRLHLLERRVLFCTLDGTHLPEFHDGIAADEVEPNDTPASATPFTASDALNGSIASGSDLDYFVTTMAHGDRLRVRPGTDPGQRHYKPMVQVRDAAGNVLISSGDGHEINFFAPTAGQYYVRLSSDSSYGTFTGSYGSAGGSNLVSVTVSAFSGTTEVEPNDTLGSATSIGATTNFRGALSSGSDVDAFSFSGTGGNAVSFKFVSTAGNNPAIQLFDPSNNPIASDSTGAGLFHVLPSTGTYRFTVASSASFTSGGYAGTFIRGAGPIVQESEPANNGLDGAVPWNITTGVSRAVGRIAGASDLDLFSFDFTAGRWYSFSLETNSEQMARAGRRIALFNEAGQVMESSFTGSLSTNAATGFGFRIERTGKHYLAIDAIDPTGVGSYSITGQQTSTFPTQRDVPLVFHDYTGQRTHLGYGPAAPLLNPASIPAFIGMFEGRYDVYDLDITQTNPGTDVIGFGAGEFGSIGAYGYGGSFNLGTRRARGDSVLDDSGASFTSLANIRNPASVMNQEIGHAAGLYAHARNPQAFMAYDSQSAMNVVGMYYPFPWTDSRVPDVESRNEREFQDWVFQAGRIAEELEPNDTLGAPQSLNGFLAEMTGDADARNDRVALAGRIASGADADVYSLTVSAGQKFAIDIDSAEFQNPLDATLRVFDASGNPIASSFNALDRESGLDSVDPYLTHTFATAGTYKIEVTGANATVGNYRLKLTSGAAFDTAGPRVIASWPNGGASVDGTRQLVFWFNDKLDPATVKPSNIIVEGATTGVRSGSAVFDTLDGTLIWRADAPLAPDTYTITFKGGATGIKDLRGNRLDGETDGSMTFPEISGNGTNGGDFVTSFTITAPDTSPAGLVSNSTRRHPYNRVLLTITYNDDLDVQSVYGSNLALRGAGADNNYGTGDDYFVPFDINYDKVKLTGGSKVLEVYTRGVPSFGNYRLEGSMLDAAGNTVNVSTTFAFTSSVLSSGPSVANVSIQPGTAVVSATNRVDVTFSAAVNLATLTSGSFVLRHSSDATFFDGNDTLISDADGAIAWDAQNLTARFQAAANFADGYYMIELDGDAGGITSPAGARLDGDWLDSHIAGNTTFTHWQDAPSGDGFAGGDYRATFVVKLDTAAPLVEASQFIYQTAPQRIEYRFDENVGASLGSGDLLLENLTSGQTIPAGSIAVAFDPSSNVASFTFPAFQHGALPNGQYRATLLSAGVTDAAGNALASNHVSNFFFMLGDADNNGIIDGDDYAMIDNGFNNNLSGWINGDFDYDGDVDGDDYAIIDFAFNTQ